jgi:integrin alpha FG-GAP repeat containing protein 1
MLMMVMICVGDYNLDGYPDLLVTTTKKVMLLQSVWCSTQGQCTDQAIKSSKRTFSLIRSGAESLTRLSNPRHATFFDIDEDVKDMRKKQWYQDLLTDLFFLRDPWIS